jgi:chromosome segregation ATPase
MTDLQKRISELNTELEQLNSDLEKEKGTIPQTVQARIQEIQTQANTYKALADQNQKAFDEVHAHNQKIAETNRKLSETARLMSAENQASVGRARIRQKWRTDTTDLHVAIAKFVAEIPSLVDQESLEGDDWARQAECVEVLQRALSALKQMRNSRSNSFIESSFVDSAQVIDSEEYEV